MTALGNCDRESDETATAGEGAFVGWVARPATRAVPVGAGVGASAVPVSGRTFLRPRLTLRVRVRLVLGGALPLVGEAPSATSSISLAREEVADLGGRSTLPPPVPLAIVFPPPPARRGESMSESTNGDVVNTALSSPASPAAALLFPGLSLSFHFRQRSAMFSCHQPAPISAHPNHTCHVATTAPTAAKPRLRACSNELTATTRTRMLPTERVIPTLTPQPSVETLPEHAWHPPSPIVNPFLTTCFGWLLNSLGHKLISHLDVPASASVGVRGCSLTVAVVSCSPATNVGPPGMLLGLYPMPELTRTTTVALVGAGDRMPNRTCAVSGIDANWGFPLPGPALPSTTQTPSGDMAPWSASGESSPAGGGSTACWLSQQSTGAAARPRTTTAHVAVGTLFATSALVASAFAGKEQQRTDSV